MQYSPVFEHLFERLISKREKFFSGFRYGPVSPSLSGCHTVRNELIFEGKIPPDRKTRNDLEGSLAFLANFVVWWFSSISRHQLLVSGPQNQRAMAQFQMHTCSTTQMPHGRRRDTVNPRRGVFPFDVWRLGDNASSTVLRDSFITHSFLFTACPHMLRCMNTTDHTLLESQHETSLLPRSLCNRFAKLWIERHIILISQVIPPGGPDLPLTSPSHSRGGVSSCVYRLGLRASCRTSWCHVWTAVCSESASGSRGPP